MGFGRFFVIDPLRELVAVLMVNERNYPFPRWVQLFRTLVYQSIAQ